MQVKWQRENSNGPANFSLSIVPFRGMNEMSFDITKRIGAKGDGTVITNINKKTAYQIIDALQEAITELDKPPLSDPEKLRLILELVTADLTGKFADIKRILEQ